VAQRRRGCRDAFSILALIDGDTMTLPMDVSAAEAAYAQTLGLRSRTTSPRSQCPYGEQRFVTLGLLAGVPVSIVHTENEHEIRIISFRKATNRDALIFFNEVQH
jgi:uncharacterized DUF497 family protein